MGGLEMSTNASGASISLVEFKWTCGASTLNPLSFQDFTSPQPVIRSYLTYPTGELIRISEAAISGSAQTPGKNLKAPVGLTILHRLYNEQSCPLDALLAIQGSPLPDKRSTSKKCPPSKTGGKKRRTLEEDTSALVEANALVTRFKSMLGKAPAGTERDTVSNMLTEAVLKAAELSKAYENRVIDEAEENDLRMIHAALEEGSDARKKSPGHRERVTVLREMYKTSSPSEKASSFLDYIPGLHFIPTHNIMCMPLSYSKLEIMLSSWSYPGHE